MKRAQYFCSGVEDIKNYHHYALACPLYTHFTSPIRRYCDVIVHRLLDFAIRSVSEENVKLDLGIDSTRVSKIAGWCNLHKDASKNAQDASQKVFLCAFLLTEMLKGDVCETAIVHQISDRSIDVIVPRYGIQSRVYVEDLIDRKQAIGSHYDGKELTVYWKKNVDGIADTLSEISLNEGKKSAVQQKYRTFDEITVLIEIDQTKTLTPKLILMKPVSN